MSPDSLIFATCLVIQMVGDSSVGTASGFFYRQDDRTFFITNKHVVTFAAPSSKPSLALALHADNNDISKITIQRIPLFSRTNRLWHQLDDVAIDVVAITIMDDVLLKAHIVPFSKADFPPKRIELALGEDLLAVGYPRGFHDRLNFTPVIRNCTIATPTSTPFEGIPLFLIDGNFHPGMSGSPIVTKPSSSYGMTAGMTLYDSPRTFLVGIHSSTVYQKIDEKKEPLYGIERGQIVIKEFKTVEVKENLGLHSCWFNTVIINIIKQIPK